MFCADFSGSSADKEFWTHERHDMEKEILWRKTHQKYLATVSNQSSGWTSKGSNSSGGHEKSSRSKHNAKQRKLYKKCLKARKVEHRKQAMASTLALAVTAASKKGQ